MSLLDRRVPVDLFHITYMEGDVTGFAMAWVSMTPIILLVALGTLLFVRHHPAVPAALSGAIVCEASSLLLKRLIKQPRPTPVVGDGYGMPSSHSMMMFFFAAFYISLPTTRQFSIARKGKALALSVLAVAVAVSRVYLTYHTTEQVLVGAVLGSILGTLWAKIVAYRLVCLANRATKWSKEA